MNRFAVSQWIALCWMVLSAPTGALAGAVDWRHPWYAPHDAAAARERSDEYAWRLFIALNWPADSQRRRADAQAALGASGPVVWETWMTVNVVYRQDGADPGPWRSGSPENLSAMHRFETVSLKDLPNARHIVGGIMVPLVDPLSDGRPLTESRLNRPTFDYIRARELYTVEGQQRAAASGHTVSFPYGACEVKAQWRPITAAEQPRYHTLWVRLVDGTRRLYGLTALNIASKDLPTWFWATFEHVDNASLPDAEGWSLPSRDQFACPGQRDCNRAPRGVGLDGTVWQNYRLRGTLTRFIDATGQPQLLANSQLERGFQTTSSCITCHARASISTAGTALRLPVFADTQARRGFTGAVPREWYVRDGSDGQAFQPLDFVWSLSLAQRRTGTGLEVAN